MYIRYQKIVRNPDGTIRSGSASLMQNHYVANKDGDHSRNHSKAKVIERLGKVLWLEEGNPRRAIFNSPSRGLVFYDLDADTFLPVEPSDVRLKGTVFEAREPMAHVNFGNAFLFFSVLEKTPLMNALRSAFKDGTDLRKVLAHVYHDCTRNGSAVKCGAYIERSIASHVLEGIPFSSLDCDSAYFFMLSDDRVKVSWFKSLIAEMRKAEPDFGRACYVDSTPLPGDAADNPFNALSSHGTDGARIQSRMVLLLDVQTGIPVWFDIIPANVLDKSTIIQIAADVKDTLDITVDMYDLDAGYAREELFDMFNIDNGTYTDGAGAERIRSVLVRMPAAKGYPHDELYLESKPRFHDSDHLLDYEHHTFYGERYEISLFGNREYAFVFVDKTQAEKLSRRWRETHPGEWECMSRNDRDYSLVKDGFFILVGNRDQSCREALVEYRGRAKIETFFRDAKTYLSILPIAKWTKERVLGKILHDVIETTFYREYRRQVAPLGISMSTLLGCMDGWECHVGKTGILEAKTPNKDAREIVEGLGYSVPAHLPLDDFKKQVLGGVGMSLEPLTVKKKRPGRKKASAAAKSPEEKAAEAEARKLQKEQEKAEEKARKQAEREKKKEERERQREEEKAKRKEEKERQRREKKQASAEKPGQPAGTAE